LHKEALKVTFAVLLWLFACDNPIAAAELTFNYRTDRSAIEFSGYLVKVADYFEAPPRVAVDTLDQAAQASYVPTGKLYCTLLNGRQTYKSSAQLTYKHDLITTVGHALINIDGTNCEAQAKPQDCKFIITVAGKTREVGIASLVGTGLSCPSKNSPDDDWAVMRLKEPIEDVKPYSVEGASEYLDVGTQVITVAHSVDFKSGAQHELGAKHFGKCSVLQTYGGFPPASVSTACGASHGSSGGSLLSLDPDPVLLGVVSQVNETSAEANKAQARGKPRVLHWQKDGNGTYYRTLSGDFALTLMEAGERSAD
jgi:hypothetical protein